MLGSFYPSSLNKILTKPKQAWTEWSFNIKLQFLKNFQLSPVREKRTEENCPGTFPARQCVSGEGRRGHGCAVWALRNSTLSAGCGGGWSWQVPLSQCHCLCCHFLFWVTGEGESQTPSHSPWVWDPPGPEWASFYLRLSSRAPQMQCGTARLVKANTREPGRRPSSSRTK